MSGSTCLLTPRPTFGEMMTVKQSFVVDGAPNGFFIRNGNWTVSDKNGGAGMVPQDLADTEVDKRQSRTIRSSDEQQRFLQRARTRQERSSTYRSIPPC